MADVKLATHIVCDPTYNELKNIEISENQMAVTDHVSDVFVMPLVLYL